MIASNSGPRWRTRMSTSPGPLSMRRASPSTSSFTARAMLRARASRAGLSRSRCRTARPSLRSRVRSSGLISGPRFRPGPARASGSADVRRNAGLVGGHARAWPARARTPDRRQPSTLAPERNECWNCMREIQPDPSVELRARNARRISSNAVAAPRPGTRRSTASRRRPRIPCAARSRARRRAVNSATMRAHDLPLLRAGILRLVDQHVVDAEIELVVHPGGATRLEQCERLVDQVVVVEQPAAFLLGARSARSRRVAMVISARGALAGVDRALRAASSAQTRSCSAMSRSSQSGWLSPIALVTMILARLELGGAEDLADRRRCARGPMRRAAASKRRDCSLSVLEPRVEQPRSAPAIPLPGSASRAKNSSSTHSIVSAGAMPSAARQLRDRRVDAAGCVDPAAIRVALADRFADRHRGRSGRRRPRWRWRARGRARCPARPTLPAARCSVSSVEQLRLRGLVQHGEARRDIGLERKLMQQPRAEGVDGLHLQPARRLQRRGEQPPRPRALRRRPARACRC